VLSMARDQFDEALTHLTRALDRLPSGESTGAPEGMLVVELLNLSQEDARALQNEFQALLAKYNKNPAGRGDWWHVVISAVPPTAP